MRCILLVDGVALQYGVNGPSVRCLIHLTVDGIGPCLAPGSILAISDVRDPPHQGLLLSSTMPFSADWDSRISYTRLPP
jgi:hypothetical protein